MYNPNQNNNGSSNSKYKNEKNNINNKSDRVMRGVATWCSFYRANPQRFVEEYLGIKLYLFQQIIIYLMNINNKFIYLASRGQGKSLIIAIFCVMKCILYPETIIVIASKTRGQALEVIEKIINILKPKSSNLAMEIKEFNTTPINGHITFRNNSSIKIVTANDNARHNRANIMVIDEYRMVDKAIIDSVIKKFLTAERHPKFLDKPEYCNYKKEHPNEFRNAQYYLSSCWLKSHWSWSLVQDYCVNMVQDKGYFICALPYQLAIKEEILNRLDIEEEMSESTFNDIAFTMEMRCLFFGENEDNFFKYETLNNVRKLGTALYPNFVYDNVSKFITQTVKTAGEIRIISADIAAMTSKKNKNDATAIFILQLLPTKDGQYIRNVLYSDNFEGYHTEEQALIIRRLYEEMKCDYIVLDTNGVGLGVFDSLVKDLIDKDTGILYEALSCINDNEMAARYKGNSLNPPKVIYSIKATASFNDQCAWNLRDCFTRGKTRLLITEQEFRRQAGNVKAYKDLSSEDKLNLELPYIQTTLLINELINLNYETNGTNIKIKEQYDKRKDRYSALSYGNYIATQLELKLHKRKPVNKETIFDMKKPEIRSNRR